MTLCTRHTARSTVLRWVTYIVAAVVTINHCSAFGVPLTMSRTTTISSSRTISTTTLRAERPSIANNDADDDDARINSVLTTKQALLFASTTTDDPRSEEEEGIWLRESLLTARLDLPFLRNRSVVKTSTIDTAGRGLFATRTIQEGEIITCTPGDGLLITTTTTTARNTTTPIRWGSHVGQQERGIAFDSVVKYALSIDDTYAILGHPALDEDSSYYGHYANDGAGHILFQKNVLASNNNDSDDNDDDDDDDHNTVIEAMESDYLFESLTVNNARHRPLGGDGEQYHTVMVATRDIQAGEEIFVMYGPDYWWGHP